MHPWRLWTNQKNAHLLLASCQPPSKSNFPFFLVKSSGPVHIVPGLLAGIHTPCMQLGSSQDTTDTAAGIPTLDDNSPRRVSMRRNQDGLLLTFTHVVATASLGAFLILCFEVFLSSYFDKLRFGCEKARENYALFPNREFIVSDGNLRSKSKSGKSFGEKKQMWTFTLLLKVKKGFCYLCGLMFFCLFCPRKFFNLWFGKENWKLFESKKEKERKTQTNFK